jgi:proteic killer suppression protein
MIRSFKSAEMKRVWEGQSSRKLPNEVQNRALRKLRLRNPPGNELKALKGDRAGQMSIRINDQWRICFRWIDHDAWDLEIVDYH